MDFDFKMRLIGFYNTPKQNMKEEECRLIEAEELANLLGETFRNLTHFVSDDLVFKSVLKGNTVFILKDEENNLYAYYPYKRIARLTDVVYDKGTERHLLNMNTNDKAIYKNVNHHV